VILSSMIASDYGLGHIQSSPGIPEESSEENRSANRSGVKSLNVPCTTGAQGLDFKSSLLSPVNCPDEDKR
jgi:hypothetical protein